VAQLEGDQVKKFCRGPWCEVGRRTYAGKPFGRDEMIEKAAGLQPFVLHVCDEATKDHAESLRQYAHVGPHGDNVICVAEAFLDLPRDRRDGLLAHEIGHLIADPDGSEEGADAAFEALTGITIRYKDDGDGECLQWLRPEDSKKLEGLFEFDLSEIEDKRRAANPVEEGETEAGRRRRLEIEAWAIREAVRMIVEVSHDTEWGYEIYDRLDLAMSAASNSRSFRVGQKAVDKIWLETLRRAQRLALKHGGHHVSAEYRSAIKAEQILQLSKTEQGRALIRAELDAQRAREEAAREIPRPPPLPSARPEPRPISGPSEDERRKTREEAISEIEGLMDPLRKAELALEAALLSLKYGHPRGHKEVEETQALVQDLRARYEAARQRRDKASNPRRR
jgi:hypothetical protein